MAEPLGTGGSGTAAGSSTTPIQGGPSTSLQGWHALTLSLAASVPTSLRRAAAIRRAALRALK